MLPKRARFDTNQVSAINAELDGYLNFANELILRLQFEYLNNTEIDINSIKMTLDEHANEIKSMLEYVQNLQIPFYTNQIIDGISQNNLPLELLKSYSPVYTIGDGNCFSYAISIILFGNDNYYNIIKLLMLYEVINNSNIYAQINRLEGNITLTDMVKRCIINYAWTDSTQIYCCTRVLNRPIYKYGLFEHDYKNKNSNEIVEYLNRIGSLAHHVYCYNDAIRVNEPICIQFRSMSGDITRQTNHYVAMMKRNDNITMFPCTYDLFECYNNLFLQVDIVEPVLEANNPLLNNNNIDKIIELVVLGQGSELYNVEANRIHMDKLRKRKHIANETNEQRSQRLVKDAKHKKAKYHEQRQEAVAANLKIKVAKARKTHNLGKIILIDEKTVPQHHCGPLTDKANICTNCQAFNFKDEKPKDGKYSRCCKKGAIKIENLKPHPAYLKALMTGGDKDSKHFMQYIRRYNNALAFASFGVNDKRPPGHGPYCFKINGQIYHSAYNLHSNMYILDPNEAYNQRMKHSANAECHEDLMKNLDQLIRQVNPYAQAYKMMYELEAEEKAKALSEGREIQPIEMDIVYDKKTDRRRFNLPTSNEVAVIFTNIDGEPPHDRDIRIHCRNDQKYVKLDYWHPSCDPMTYPLFFPYGEQGWKCNEKAKGDRNITLLQHYAYRLAIRDDFNPVLNGGSLSQQYIVDGYVKSEANRLNYIRCHQQDLRAESYKGIQDHLAGLAENQGMKAGKAIILPSSFQGSPRNMHQNCMDAIAIVSKLGKPSLFITMTCNPNWPEIKDNLLPGQSSEFRPDLVARVFKLKLKELMNDIDKQILGCPVAKIHVIEFQKRGLPHAHILIILSHADKPRSREQIDALVCAEIPDKETHPRLFEIVTKNMVHGPCGSKCFVKGKCSKQFPKPFAEETLENVDGYPHYRRRKTNPIEIGNKKIKIDNSWIVPYNPFLLLKYNCHINVEICASIKSVKYLFKYVYKGYDCATVKINKNNVLNLDEIDNYLESRYISAPEAIWRLFEFKMHDKSHSIIRLAVHLPNEQNLYYRDGDDLDALLQKADMSHSTLTAWFELNKSDSDAKQYTYLEIPDHYWLDKKKWTKRKKHIQVISRIYTVDPKKQELSFLRQLLLHVKGPKSYEDIRTYNEIVNPTFKEAIRARGLLEDDTIWEQTLVEAIGHQNPSMLRQLFVTLCENCRLSDPNKLWDGYKHELIDRNIDPSVAEKIALREINDIFILFNHNNEHWGLPKAELEIIQPHDHFDQVKETEQGLIGIGTLNTEQKIIYDLIMTSIDEYNSNILDINNQIARCFFLDGPGGTGKTHLYKVLMNVLRGQGKVAIAVASTGIAANLLPGGRTYHSQFKIAIPILDNSTSSITPTSYDGRLLKRADIIIWDESTMADKYALKASHLLFSDLMGNPKYPNSNELIPFGGKVILLGGDFRQCLPIVHRGNRAQIVQASIKSSKLWSKFTQLNLTRNMRTKENEIEFSKWLLELGDGKLSQKDDELLPDHIIIPSEHLITGSLVDEVFGNPIDLNKIDELSKRAILCPLNEDTLKINNDIVAKLSGEETTFLSVDSIDKVDLRERDEHTIEELNGLTPSGLPPHKLTLKVGAIIMLLRNINTRLGLCNGTRLIVTQLGHNLIIGRVISGSSIGLHLFIPRIILSPSDTTYTFTLNRRQFPIRIAFAMTVNKSQGQTFDKVGIYLPFPCFGHGQLYVAFSRVRSKESAKVKILNTEEQGKLKTDSSDIYTRCPVYREIFEP